MLFVPSSFTLFFKLYCDYHGYEREREYGPQVENTGKKKFDYLRERERERGREVLVWVSIGLSLMATINGYIANLDAQVCEGHIS